jgi:hypothetical protein
MMMKTCLLGVAKVFARIADLFVQAAESSPAVTCTCAWCNNCCHREVNYVRANSALLEQLLASQARLKRSKDAWEGKASGGAAEALNRDP